MPRIGARHAENDAAPRKERQTNASIAGCNARHGDAHSLHAPTLASETGLRLLSRDPHAEGRHGVEPLENRALAGGAMPGGAWTLLLHVTRTQRRGTEHMPSSDSRSETSCPLD
eukprot:1816381-Rhodomonas_salina.2